MVQKSYSNPYALLVDDDFIIRAHVLNILKNAGFDVLEAAHGEAA